MVSTIGIGVARWRRLCDSNKNPIFPHATYYLYEIRTRKIYISYQVSKKSDFLGCFQIVETIGCHPKGVKPPWGCPFEQLFNPF